MNSRRLLLAAVGVVVLFVASGVGAAVATAQARSQAADLFATARTAVDLGRAGDWGGVASTLELAEAQVAEATDTLDSVFLDIWSFAPFAGSEIKAARHAVAAASHSVTAGLEVSEFFSSGLDFYDAGTLDPEALNGLAALFDRVVPEVTAARQEANAAGSPRYRTTRRALESLDSLLSTASSTLPGAKTLIESLAEAASGGDAYRVLVLFENSAELRGTGGIVGFTALVSLDGRGISLERSDATPTLHFETDGAVSAPPDFLDRYGRFLGNRLWSNVNLSPDFPTVGRVAHDLYELGTGMDADMVVRADLTGVGYLLEAFPPVEVEAKPLDSSILGTDFVIDSYLRFEEGEEQNAYLAEVLADVLDQVLASEPAEGRLLFGAIRRAIAERRLAAWTGNQREQRAFAALGAEGGLSSGGPGEVHLVVENFAANKIDLYTEMDIEVIAEPVGCLMVGEASFRIHNLAPDQARLFPAFGDIDGRWWVNVFLPTEATVLSIEVDGEPAAGSIERERGRPVAATLATAAQGASVDVTVRWQEVLSGAVYRLQMVPQPLINPARLGVNGAAPASFVEGVTVPVEHECEG